MMQNKTQESEVVPFSNPESRVCQTIDGRWLLHEILGTGGMGTVYRAEHVNNGRVAAVKVLHGCLTEDAHARERFLGEALAANVVPHPGVVEAYDDGTLADGTPFLVLEFLQGQTLEQIWEEAGERMAPSWVLRIADEVLEILEAAHSCGVVHRDVKPENIFVTKGGRIKLLDFGIAKMEGDSRVHKTDFRASMGTPAFMPPEQARGRWDEVDAQSDVWALGATMFTLMLGRLVHEAQTPAEVLLAAMTKKPAACLEVDPSLDPSVAALVDRALSFDKEARFSNATDMRRELMSIRSAVSESERQGLIVTREVRPTLPSEEGVPARSSMPPVELPLRRPVATYSVLALIPILACVGFVVAEHEPERTQGFTTWGSQMFDAVAEEGNALAARIVAEEVDVVPAPQSDAWTVMNSTDAERTMTKGAREDYAGKPLPLASQPEKEPVATPKSSVVRPSIPTGQAAPTRQLSPESQVSSEVHDSDDALSLHQELPEDQAVDLSPDGSNEQEERATTAAELLELLEAQVASGHQARDEDRQLGL